MSSLWHRGCCPNRSSKASGETGGDCKNAREDTLEIMEEMHDNAASYNRLYQANMKARHEGQVKERKFQVGELVWKAAPHARGVAGAVKHKFSPKWEGQYIVKESDATGHYWLKD